MIKPTGLARKGVVTWKMFSTCGRFGSCLGSLIKEAHEVVENEPLLGGVVHSCVLHHSSIEEVYYRIATKLASSEMSEQILREICDEAYAADASLAMAARGYRCGL